jgi:hypothetical protein
MVNTRQLANEKYESIDGKKLKMYSSDILYNRSYAVAAFES